MCRPGTGNLHMTISSKLSKNRNGILIISETARYLRYKLGFSQLHRLGAFGKSCDTFGESARQIWKQSQIDHFVCLLKSKTSHSSLEEIWLTLRSLRRTRFNWVDEASQIKFSHLIAMWVYNELRKRCFSDLVLPILTPTWNAHFPGQARYLVLGGRVSDVANTYALPFDIRERKWVGEKLRAEQRLMNGKRLWKPRKTTE